MEKEKLNDYWLGHFKNIYDVCNILNNLPKPPETQRLIVGPAIKKARNSIEKLKINTEETIRNVNKHGANK